MLKNSDEVSFFVSRVTYANSDTPENYRTMAEELSKATALIIPENRLDVIAYGCTAATVEIGAEVIFERIQSVRPGIACTTPMTGI
jgi:maleate isomerase